MNFCQVFFKNFQVINQFISDELTMENKSALADEIVTCFLSEDKRDCKKIIVKFESCCFEKQLNQQNKKANI